MCIVERLNLEQVNHLHQLYQREWWTKERSLAQTKRIVEGSQIVLGAIDDHDRLVGFARILTDYAVKAFIFDLIVDEDVRGEGIGKLLMDAILTHRRLQFVQHFELYCLPELVPYYRAADFSDKVGGIKLMRHTS